jgi:hypothetical protein
MKKQNQQNQEKIVILTGSGSNKIWIHTNLPSAIWPFTDTLTLSAEAAADTGADFVKKHFPGIKTEILGKHTAYNS